MFREMWRYKGEKKKERKTCRASEKQMACYEWSGSLPIKHFKWLKQDLGPIFKESDRISLTLNMNLVLSLKGAKEREVA